MARDLRGLVVGARITGAGVLAEDAALRGRRGVRRRRRRSHDRGNVAAREARRARPRRRIGITIHLKMTGQLFVVRAGVMEDPYIRLVLAFADGRELWFRDIRKFGRVGVARRSATTGDLEGELGGPKGFKGFGPEPLEAAFTRAPLPRGAAAAQGPAEAAPARPGLPRRRRQHLRGRGAVGRSPASARGPPRRSGPPTRAGSTARFAGSSRRRSSGVARPSTTTRRPRATARCRTSCACTSAPASRASDAAAPCVGS